MSLITERQSKAARTHADRIRFAPLPVTTPVALLAAVDVRQNGLTVFVSEETVPKDDFLEEVGLPATLYRVYAGHNNLLRSVPVVAWNEERNPLTDDLHIVTVYGTVYLPKDDIRLSPYYCGAKMYDAADRFNCLEHVDTFTVVTRK